MSQFMSVEVSGDMVGDLMNEDPGFALEVLQAIADRVQMGLLRDNAADLCAGLDAARASFLVHSFRDLSQAMRDGFNMASADTQI